MLTQERLKEQLHYDEATGIFTWRLARQGVRSGSVAGTVRPNGYIAIKIDRRLYLAHRLAWFYVYGEFPPADIDHINCMKSDNRIVNLRLATSSENQMNVQIQSNNTSGFKGVTWHKKRGKWQAQSKLNGKYRFLGYFPSAEAASEAYQAFAKRHHGEFYLSTEAA